MRFRLALLATLTLASSVPAFADNGDRKLADFAGAGGILLYLGAAAGLPLLRDHGLAREHMFRFADALLVSVPIAKGTKRLSHSKFPSGHATAAFTAAAMASEFHPNEAPLWYLGAGLIGASRVRVRAHTWAQVAGGAILGFGVSKFELSRKRGILLRPWIGEKGGMGVMASGRF